MLIIKLTIKEYFDLLGNDGLGRTFTLWRNDENRPVHKYADGELIRHLMMTSDHAQYEVVKTGATVRTGHFKEIQMECHNSNIPVIQKILKREVY